MFIFVRRKTTREYIHISHVCYKDDAGEVTIQSTVYHEENSSDTAHFSFQEVKQALIDILDDYSRQYHDLGTGSITPCPSGGLFRQIAYLASVQLFGGREDGKVVPDELLQNFETYVKTYIENSSTETTSTLIECGKCHTWNVSPGGFIFRQSDQFFCKFLGRTCYGGSSHGNALFLSKKRKISKRESQESATERFVAELWSSSEVTDSFRLGNDLISDPPDTKFKTKDNWGENFIENSMVDRQSPNYLIPPGIIGSPLTCRKPKPAFINECPWCEQVFSVNGEYDLLSDLHNFNFKTKDTKQFVSHEKNGSCVFWGLRIHRAIKCVPRITDQPLIRLRIFKSVVSVLGYGPTRISTEKHYICYEDTETKDSFLRKIYQIFCKAEDFLNETSHNPSEWTGKVSALNSGSAPP